MSCTDPPLFETLHHRIKPDTLVKIVARPHDPPRFVAGYWSIKGLAAPIRMMLSASGVNHWVALYDVMEEGEGGWSKESWTKDKEWTKKETNPFMNLPFLIDVRGDFVLCQTNAIMSYLGRELDMLGSSKIEMAKCEELLCEIYDLRNVMVRFAYGSQSNVKGCWESAKIHLGKIETHLDRRVGKVGYLVGDKLTAPDFHLFEMLDQYRHLLLKHEDLDSDGLANEFPKLVAYKEAFEALSENQFYLKSFFHEELPFNNPYAQFGSDPVTKGQYQRGKATPWKQKGVMEMHNTGARKRSIEDVVDGKETNDLGKK